MGRALFFLVGCLLASKLARAAPLMTKWGANVTSENCWREYPRPQMMRSGWTCLNGDWDYAVTSVTNTSGRPARWDGKIRVPFAIESALSGVEKLLEPDQFLWYSRKIVCRKRPDERILLHFGAVDFRAMVFIGHDEVTDVPHEGGQDAFSLDVTDFVTDGENELTVCVWDPTEGFVNSRGKQCLKPHSCFYTRVSGIWQTVWMETVPKRYIESYKTFCDIDRGNVRIEMNVRGEGEERVSIAAFDGNQKVGDFSPVSDSVYELHLKSFECWSPETPKLYQFVARCGKDEVRGYFGMRKIERRADESGVLRFFLNNRPYYILGTLDQGWWPDGLLTPPSDEAMAFDIRTLKDCGFNAMRKHIKVEPLRFYYLCDKMGLLLIQDFPCSTGDMHDPVKSESVRGYGFQRVELKRMIDGLQSVPSVIMWVPYNEGWSQPGEFLTHSTLDFVKSYDPTRLVGGPSGAWDYEGGHILPHDWAWNARVTTAHKPIGVCEAADTVDLHLYRGDNPNGLHGSHPVFPANARRISFLGEFGGLGHPVEGHLWKTTDSWGYGGVKDTATRKGLENTYLAMMDDLAGLVERGLGGSIYTQTTDVEVEINGLMTYDRRVLKFNPEVLRKAHEKIQSRLAESGQQILKSVQSVHQRGGGTVELVDGTYHFYSSSATNMRFHVSNHDQPEVRPVFLPFIGITNVALVAKNAKFVMHGMGTAILVQDSLGVSFKGITIEWERPFFAKAEIVGFEDGKTRVRFPKRDHVSVVDGKLMLSGEDWKVNLRDGNVFRRETHEMVERTADVIFSGKGAACSNGDFLVDVDLSKIGAGANVGDVYVMRNGYRPHPIVCLDRAKDTVFENFVFRDGFGMGILAQLSENVTLRGGGCYPRDRNEYNSNTIDATHFSNCRGTMTVENCRFEGMMDDALNVHSTCLGIVAKPTADTIRCRYMHHQAVGFGVFSAGDAVRFIAGRTLENGFVGKVKSVVTHDEREITLVMEKPIPPEYGVGDAVENADWQCAVVFRNNTIANNRARGVLFTTPKRIVCEGNFFDHVSGSAILFAGDAQGWYESGACEDVVIRKNRFRDCLTSVFQYCDALISMHPEVKDLRAQKRRYHRNVLIDDNEIETFDVPLLYALSAENVTWRNNRVIRNDHYRTWGKEPFAVIGGENIVIDGSQFP